MDGLYELFLVRDPNLDLYQGIFVNFPDIKEWSMNDLYERHLDPAKSFLYRYKGRKDDVVVLSNGEKIAPALMEVALMDSPHVRGAMIVGRGKFQPAALIDLHEVRPNTIQLRQQLVQSLLPFIDEANEHAPAYGKLDQYHILFTDPNRPMVYLGQGKIQRLRTYQLYNDDLEKLYEAAENPEENAGLAQSILSDLPELDFSQKASIIQWLTELLRAVAGIQDLRKHDDIFEAGADSLQIIRIARELRLQAKLAGLTDPSPDMLVPKTIYSRPTLSQLAEFLLQDAAHSVITYQQPSDFVVDITSGVSKIGNGKFSESIIKIQEIEIDDIEDSPPNGMQTLFEKYTKDLPRRNLPSVKPLTHNMTVLLTGSTGSVGSYLLDTLYHDNNVSRIICLNRSPDAAEKHRHTGLDRGLSPLNTDKVEFFKADISRHHFGLDDDSTYKRLVQTVTHVIRKKSHHIFL